MRQRKLRARARRGHHPLAAAAMAALVFVAGGSALAGTPTLTTITIDGNFGDWAAVLADPDNVFLDGPAGGRPDLDAPSDAYLDIDTVAFTWDATNLYFYIHRQGTVASVKYFWFFLDANNNGRMEQGEPMLRLEWHGSSRSTNLRRDSYAAVNTTVGDAISNAGVHDGYKLPGQNTNGPGIGNLNGGSLDGKSAEAVISWANVGVAAGSAMNIHISSTRNSAAIPSDVADNVGGTNYYTTVAFVPNRAVTTTPGTSAVMAHTITNTGNVADVFDLSFTTSGTFTPSSVTFYRDADASGTLTAGDTVLADTDADGKVDTGSVAGLGGVIRVLTVIATPNVAVGKVATVVGKATSSVDMSVSDTATDVVTLGGPVLTLLKSASRATATPGQSIAYTVTYTNAGNLDAQNVVLIDPVPSPAKYLPGSASGAGTAITYSHDGGATYDASQAGVVTHVKWTFAAGVAAAATGTVGFSVTVP
ncbi:MAG: DUF11 domain-containing protein [Acidobacteria bacterium]|nr:DUF11 domain-containing protein [Acidobacteriota bacterium]